MLAAITVSMTGPQAIQRTTVSNQRTTVRCLDSTKHPVSARSLSRQPLPMALFRIQFPDRFCCMAVECLAFGRERNKPCGGLEQTYFCLLFQMRHCLCDGGAGDVKPGGCSRKIVRLSTTCVYGESSSHCGMLFDLASRSDSVLELIVDPNTIMHSVDVDDCAEAYVALAEHPRREEVAQQAFNISHASYETAGQVGEALASAYGLKLRLVPPQAELPLLSVHALAQFSQWVSSDRLRTLTGWTERKPNFSEGIKEYRLTYEAAKRDKG